MIKLQQQLNNYKNKMKKSILAISFILMLAISGLTAINAQEQPAPKKDTVNMDTDAKPTQYYDIEDDKTEAGSESKSSAGLVIGIVCAVVVVGSVVYFVGKKKKK
jgi:flagellar basal body-associated protein FliL